MAAGLTHARVAQLYQLRRNSRHKLMRRSNPASAPLCSLQLKAPSGSPPSTTTISSATLHAAPAPAPVTAGANLAAHLDKAPAAAKPDAVTAAAGTRKVAVVGSGVWATAAAKLAAYNARSSPLFDTQVTMWVRNEGLAADINAGRGNTRYLPHADLGPNVAAEPDLAAAVDGAGVVVLCVPHQFARGVCEQLREVGCRLAPGAVVVSLVKGVEVCPDQGARLVSEMAAEALGVPCGVLMGANIAEDIGAEQLGEGTVAFADPSHRALAASLFATPWFHVQTTADVAGAELCGTLKNVVALAVGMAQGLGRGLNSQAALLRVGINEARALAHALYPGRVDDATFFESCGVADFVATAMGGRNRRVAEAYTVAHAQGRPATWDELEAALLKGQKLQGVLSANEVGALLRARGWAADFPLLATVHRVAAGEAPPAAVLRYREAWRAGEEAAEEVAKEVAAPVKATALALAAESKAKAAGEQAAVKTKRAPSNGSSSSGRENNALPLPRSLSAKVLRRTTTVLMPALRRANTMLMPPSANPAAAAAAAAA